MRLFLIRHPRPLIAPGICYGSADLSVAPEEQTRCASLLAERLPKGTPIFSSPLQRCSGLANALASLLESAPVVFDARLAEMNFGNWEMQPWDEVPFAEVDAWSKDLVNYPPGFGESVLGMAGRVHAFYEDARKRDSDAIVVCHAGTIRLLLKCQRDLPIEMIAQAAAATPHEIAYGAMVALDDHA